MRKWLILWAFGLVFGVPNGLSAQTSTEEKLKQLEQEIQQIKDQSLKSESDEAESNSNISFHGYGELHYNSSKADANVPADEGKDSARRMDFHRMVWGLSYALSDRISLHTEVDFEHAAQEIELEYAYLDFLVNPAFNVRAGAVLMPVGPLNEFHEPPLFYSVERPYVQNAIIPTTWQEGGAGLFGSLLPDLKYRLYVVSGLNANGFSDSTGIRGGRGKVAGGSGSVAKVPPLSGDELAVVGRVEYAPLSGLTLGGSGYKGGANQEEDTALDEVEVQILEGDLRYRVAGLDLTGVYTRISISDPEKITAKCTKKSFYCSAADVAGGVTEAVGVGEELVGWYVEGAYDLLSLIQSDQRLMAFVRFEEINTQEEMPTGIAADPKNDRQVTTFGVAYYPITDVALKADFERWENEATTNNEGNRFNLGLAYMF